MIDEAVDHDTFLELSDSFVVDIIHFVKEWELEQGESKKVPETFWKALKDSTVELIRQVVLEGHEDEESDQEDEVEHLLQLIEIKA